MLLFILVSDLGGNHFKIYLFMIISFIYIYIRCNITIAEAYDFIDIRFVIKFSNTPTLNT